MSNLLEALERSLLEMKLEKKDDAAVELATQYARCIDSAPLSHLEKFGHKFLAALESLGMTPKARAALLKENGNDTGTSNPLEALRANRDKRDKGLADSPNMDSTLEGIISLDQLGI